MEDRFPFDRSPLPANFALPERVSAAYEAEACLAGPADGRLVLRLRRKSDGAPAVLKAVPAGREDLAEEFRLLQRLAPLLPGKVPEPVDCWE